MLRFFTYKRSFFLLLFIYFVNNYIKTSNLIGYIKNHRSVNAIVEVMEDSEEKEMKIYKPELTRTKSEEELLLTGEPVITSSSDDESDKIDPELQIVND